MPHYRYKARSNRGEAVEGLVEAASADAVAAQLFAGGITPVDIVESAPPSDTLGALRRALGLGQPRVEDLLLFSRQMHALTKSGVPIIRGLTGLAQSTRNAALQDALLDVAGNLDAGRDLAGSLARHPRIFPPLFIAVVQVGENSGQLDGAFLQMYQYLEREKDARDRVKAAIRYPLVALGFILAAISVINLWVIPVFAKIFAKSGVPLPLPTRLLMASSEFMLTWWPQLLIGAVAGLFLFNRWLRTARGRYLWHRLLLRLPAVGPMLHRAALARFARSFAMSLQSGVPLIQALTAVARAVGNDFIGERILMLRNGVERGEALSRTAATTGQFTPLVLQMLEVGEQAGRLDQMLVDVADFYDREVDYDIKYLSDAIQPFLVVVIGILVAILALGVFLPMWDMGAAAFAKKGG